MSEESGGETVGTVRIPADVERQDTVLGPLTARQTVLLAGGGLLLYGGYWALRAWMSPLAYLAMVTPVAGVLIGLALGRREGISMECFARAAVAHARAPKRHVHAPEGVPELPSFLDRALARQAGPAPVPAAPPCRGIDEAGVLDLGREGRAAVACCSTVPFEVRSGAEQEGLAAGFARWVNALTGPAQIVLRTRPMDLRPAAARLRQQAAGAAHPGLAAAAGSHADFLNHLAERAEPLARQVLLVAREPGTTQQAASRAARRIADAVRALAAADVEIRPLDAGEAAETVQAACNPEPPTGHYDDDPHDDETGGEEC